MAPKLEWNKKRFMLTVRSQITSNADKAGQFMVDEAKDILTSYATPKFGKKYRSYVAKLIKYEVIQEDNAVVVNVEVDKTKKFWAGAYIEIGSKKYKKRRPFMRPAIFGNMRKVINILME